MNLKQFLKEEFDVFVNEVIRPRGVVVQQVDETQLIERASAGVAVRGFLESRYVQEFMVRAEANMTTALLNLPLDDDKGRRNLAVAIQSHRQLLRYLGELARDGRAAEAELQRLAEPKKGYF